MHQFNGTPTQGLAAATLGFFFGFAAVALFGTTAVRLEEVMGLSALEVSLLVAIPSLTGSLLRIPFSGWVDSTGGRKPLLTLLLLSAAGLGGLTVLMLLEFPNGLVKGHYYAILVLGALAGCGIATFSVGTSQVAYWYPQARQGRALALFAGVGNLAPGFFTLVLPLALVWVGLGGAYVIWFALLVVGTALYAMYGRNAWYFQLLRAGHAEPEARSLAVGQGQELFPVGGLRQSLGTSARAWRTWALVCVYFATFGGFIALTAWLPTYWMRFHGLSLVMAGLLTAGYSILTSAFRIVGGVLSDQLREGGENTGILSLMIMLMGAMMMTLSAEYQVAIPGLVLMAFGMGFTNAAVFKLVPQLIPQAVGGASGWVGGLGALGGFVIPPVMGFAVLDLGLSGYRVGFVTFVFLAILALWMMWIIKYTRQEMPVPVPEPERMAPADRLERAL